MEFTASSLYTLGVEVEFQTLDAETLNLAPLAPILQGNAPPILRPRIAKEFIRSILEIRTGACFTLDDVEYDLQQTCSLAEELAQDNGAVLYSASLHPFARIDDQVLSSDGRYKRIMDELQLVGRQFISQGFHVHIGMPDGDTGVRVWNAIQKYLPIFLALSASSPYFQGVDTGFMSYRTKLFEMLPLAGIYNRFTNWQDLVEGVDRLKGLGIIGGLNDLWWDARLNPVFGTLEIRICDLPGRFKDILGLTAAMQCLAAFLAEQKDDGNPPDYTILQANKWQAARHGLQGRFIDPADRLGPGPVGMKRACSQLLKCIQPYSVRLGCASHLQQVEDLLVRDSVAALQRRIYKREKSFLSVIRALQEEFWK